MLAQFGWGGGFAQMAITLVIVISICAILWLVAEVCIAQSGITYRVVWWTGHERKSEWVADFEVCCGADTPRTPIGFVQK